MPIRGAKGVRVLYCMDYRGQRGWGYSIVWIIGGGGGGGTLLYGL